MKQQCYYCGNNATTKDFRTWNGITGKELVCDVCFSVTNEGLLDREAKYQGRLKDIFDKSGVDNLIDIGMNNFWDSINEEVNKLAGDLTEDFNSDSVDDHFVVHESDVEEWRDKTYNLIAKKLKKQL